MNLLKKTAVCFISAAMLLCTACNENTLVNTSNNIEQTQISFSWWGNDARNEYTLKAIEKFEKLHPEISVKCKYSEWSGYQTRNKINMVSNTETDVMQINYAWIQQYSPDGNGYYDLSLLSDKLKLYNFSSDELNYGMQNGKLNAIPIALNTLTVYINKTIYDEYGVEIPQKWEDFYKAAEAMNGEVYPISMNAKPAYLFTAAYVEQQRGKHILKDDGTLNFNAHDLQLMIEMYIDMVNNNVMPLVEYFEKLDLEEGKSAGTIAWLSDATNYCGGAVENGYEIVIADYTTDDNSEIGDGWYAKPATMYAISSNTEYPEESALLLDFLLNSSEMAELQRIEKGIPLSKDARNYLSDNDLLSGMQYDAFLKMNEYSYNISILSPYFENEKAVSKFIDACNTVYFERSDIETASIQLYKDLVKIYG